MTIGEPCRVLVNGAQGKMGSLATQTLRQQSDFEVIAEVGSNQKLDKEISRLSPDLVVDFTNANAIHDNMRIIIEANVPAVIGTTGLSAENITNYKEQCNAQKQGVILAPNFSICVLLMMKYAADAAKYFNEVEIIEMHHPQKLDAPSGSARKTARMIAEANPAFRHAEKLEEKNISRGGKYDENHIPIHAIRLSGKMAHQQVIFGASGETLTLQHDTLSRDCFMPGFLVACRAAPTLHCFVEGLENILWPGHMAQESSVSS
jgi:4-hydroxy-tetrahydrodipicolinate reductase